MSIDLTQLLYNGVNGLSEYDIRRSKTYRVCQSVKKCTDKNTNQSVSKPRVSE